MKIQGTPKNFSKEKKLIQDGKIYIAKYFPENNMPVFCFSHCNFNSLENTL